MQNQKIQAVPMKEFLIVYQYPKVFNIIEYAARRCRWIRLSDCLGDGICRNKFAYVVGNERDKIVQDGNISYVLAFHNIFEDNCIEDVLQITVNQFVVAEIQRAQLRQSAEIQIFK